MLKEVESYAELVRQGKGENRREEIIKRSGRKIIPSNTPIGLWLENTCKNKNITLTELCKILNLSGSLNLNGRKNAFGLNTLSNILQILPEALDLSGEETEVLSEAVAQTIQQRLEDGHTFQDGPRGRVINKIQEGFVCRTYNGAEASDVLEVSRERVSKLRQKFGLPVLLTEENVETIRIHLEKTREIREKIQKTRYANR